MLKRTLDIFGSLFFLIILSPIFFITAFLVRLDSAGPVFFSQKRAGKDGKIFKIHKFRTMVENAELLGPCITAKNDPRITQIGHLLRWLKIDELPQFWNVLKGEMSLVGPRPEVPEMTAKYTEEERRVLSVLPGIIGPTQISNRDEAEKLPESGVEDFYAERLLPEKIRGDLLYVRNKDPFKDLKILFGGGLAFLLGSIKVSYILESRRRFVFLLVDMAISAASYTAAVLLRFEGKLGPSEFESLKALLPLILFLRAPCFIYFGLYQSLWQYLGTQDLIAIAKAASVGSLCLPFIPFFLGVSFHPRSVLVIDWFLLIMMLGASRIVFKLTAERLRSPKLDNRKNVLLVGTGDAAEMLVREFIKQPGLGLRPVGFLDSDPMKHSIRIHGVKVMGSVRQLAQITRVRKVDQIIIAKPDASSEEIKEILAACRKLKIPCRIAPAAASVFSPAVLPLKLRAVEVSDLLGRRVAPPDLEGIQHFIREKRVLITGAGGSIGSQLARTVFENHPRELILLDNSESNLYDIETDLRGKPSQTEVFSYLRSIAEAEGMRKVFERHKPQLVCHAAAYKHVPLMEIHYGAGILNNVLGTQITADLAAAFEAECFVMISTDKAINPRSIMGATKRIAELYIRSLKNSKTRFLSVRFGNVFESRGSVVPLFKKQIEQGGPVTITDPEMTRYFMDISEAVFLVLQAAILGRDSEIFVLDMGEPVRILDLAQNLIHLAGLKPGEIPIKFVGLRPGEKLEEELELDAEKAVATPHRKIKIWKSPETVNGRITSQIEALIALVREGAGREAVTAKLKEIVPEYSPFNWKDLI